MKPLRVAVIGAGHLGKIHARLAAGLEDIELVAVCDLVEGARNAVAQEANTRAVADYRSLVGEIEAAIIATPTTYHHAVGMELLGCGIPLLVEKPLALTAAEATDLVTLARQKGVTLQVGHVERFNPALTAVAADVRDPKYIEAHRTSGYTFRSTDIGVVMDIMIHDLDVVLSLAKSEVVDVQALGHFRPRRSRRYGYCTPHVREWLCGTNLRFARQLPTATDDVDLHVTRQRVDQFRHARSHGRETDRRSATPRVSRRPAYGGRAWVLERACLRPASHPHRP